MRSSTAVSATRTYPTDLNSQREFSKHISASDEVIVIVPGRAEMAESEQTTAAKSSVKKPVNRSRERRIAFVLPDERKAEQVVERSFAIVFDCKSIAKST
jgi:hypothetical protein